MSNTNHYLDFMENASNASNASNDIIETSGVYMSFEQKMETLIDFYNKYIEQDELITISVKDANEKIKKKKKEQVQKPENEPTEKVCGELQRLLNQKNKKQRL